jgi:hypothetical protein
MGYLNRNLQNIIKKNFFFIFKIFIQFKNIKQNACERIGCENKKNGDNPSE